MIRVRAHEQIAPLAGAWDELVDELGATPFVRPRHVELHREAFGGGRPRTLTVERGDALVGVLPLHRVRGSWRSQTNWHTPGNSLVVADDDALAALVRFLRDRGPARTELRFLHFDDTERVRREVDYQGGLTLRTRVLERSPYVQVAGRDHGAYLGERRSRFRRELRRRRRRLAEHGEVACVVHDGQADLDRLLERGLAIEAAGWKGRAGTAIAADPATRAYYTGLARWAAEHGWLALAFLEVAGEAVAFDFGIETGGLHHLLKTGYDPAWSDHSPGQLLREDMIARAFALGLDRYEFGGDDDAYKLEWTDTVHVSNALDLHPSTLAGRGSQLLQEHARPLAQRAVTGVRATVGGRA